MTSAHDGTHASRGEEGDARTEIKERDPSPFSWAAAAAASRINFGLDPELSMSFTPETWQSTDARDMSRKEPRRTPPSTMARMVGHVEGSAEHSRARARGRLQNV
jgi:hypothetical protein